MKYNQKRNFWYAFFVLTITGTMLRRINSAFTYKIAVVSNAIPWNDKLK
jgi:hypothetical protein